MINNISLEHIYYTITCISILCGAAFTIGYKIGYLFGKNSKK